MTQRDVAGDELSVSYVSLLEAGRRQPTPETVRILARALRCKESDLLDSEAPGTEPLALVVRQGELALETGREDVARQRFEHALSRDADDPMLRLRATIGLARSLQKDGQLARAADLYEDAVRTGLDDSAYGASIELVLRWARCLYEMGDLVRATEVGTSALARLDSLEAKESELAVQLLATVAAAWYELGDLRQAERLLREGLQRSRSVASPGARGAILWNASTLAHEQGKFQQALELADEALRIFQGGTDRHAHGRLLTTYGYFLLRQPAPDPGRALEVLHEALADLRQVSAPIDCGYALTEIAHAHLALGQVQEAVSAATESRDLLGPGARLEYARATAALAAATHAGGDEAAARRLFEEAATRLEGMGASRHAARAWIEQAEVLASSGDTGAALQAYRRAARAMHLLAAHPAAAQAAAATLETLDAATPSS